MRSKHDFHLRVIALSALVLICGAQALAQNATGAITGTIIDPNNAVVPKAVITVTNKATGAVRKLASGSEGAFSVENLTPGDYEVKAEAQGFITQLQMLAVQIGSTTTANFSLTVGAASQTVEVTASSSAINTTDTVVGGVVSRERVENLPLNGRSFLSVALLEPGVSVNYAAQSGAGNVNNFFQVSIGSAPQSMTVISVDGARVNDRVTGGTSQNFSSETMKEPRPEGAGDDPPVTAVKRSGMEWPSASSVSRERPRSVMPVYRMLPPWYKANEVERDWCHA